MHIADILSRLAGKDLDPPDKVIPISFSAMQPEQPLRTSPRIKRLSQQKPLPVDKFKPPKLPPSFKPQVVLNRLQYPDNDLT